MLLPTTEECMSSSLLKETKGKQLLKEKADLLTSTGGELFGIQFKDDWCSSMKTKQRYQELLNKEVKSSRQPFRGGISWV